MQQQSLTAPCSWILSRLGFTLSSQIRPQSFAVQVVLRSCRCTAAAASRRRPSRSLAPPPHAAPSPPDVDERQQLTDRLGRVTRLSELRSLLESHPDELVTGDLGAVALMAAAQLEPRDRSGGNDADEAYAADVELQEKLLDQLVAAQLPNIKRMPLPTVAAIALALSSAGYYDPQLFEEIAAAALAGLLGVTPWEAPVVLTALGAGFSTIGHYDESLFDALAAKVAELRAANELGPAPLLAVAAAALEVQHYSPPLLEALAAAVRVQGAGALPPDQLADALLVLAFFRAAPDDIAEQTTATVGRVLRGTAPAVPSAPKGFGPAAPPPSAAQKQQSALGLGDEQVSRLARAAMLLRSQGSPVSPDLISALAARPPERLLAADHLLADPDLAAEAMAQPQGPQWEAAGLFAAAQVVVRLRDGLGHEVTADIVAGGQGPLFAEVDMAITVAPDGGPASTAGTGSNQALRQVAIAVLDEQTCYCTHPAGRLRGSSAVQVLALKSLGWAVAPLPVREWQELGGDKAAQDAYLRARIIAALAQ